ncbi:hypothetical protein LZ30DRAFT_699847 [Colletotrichum cereale]|nr:hypothetical protein LZ30DRAFT_699847 [Colletotrichum cereale]
MVGTKRVERVGGGESGGSGEGAAVGGNLVPEAPASNSSTASAGKAIHTRQNSSSTVSAHTLKLSTSAQVSDTKATLRSSLPSGPTETRYPISPTPNSLENNEQADIAYQADHSASSCEETQGDEDEEDSDEVHSTRCSNSRLQSNKGNWQTPKNKMSFITPSTMGLEQSSTDPFVDEATPQDDTPIPINLSSAPRPKSPDLESGSSSLSSMPSTPTKAPAERRRPASVKPKVTALQEAAREARSVAAEIKETRAEYKRARGLFEHLTRDENATPEILDAAVDATNRRLVRAVEDDEKIQSGNPPRHVPYPPERIPDLLAAVEKAEADRENWYAETRRLFWLFETIDRERMPALKLKMEEARKKEAAAKQKKDRQAPVATSQKPAPVFGTPSDKGNTSGGSPATVRRIRPNETPIASPVTSDASNQATIVRGIRNAMRRAADAAKGLEAPAKKSRR